MSKRIRLILWTLHTLNILIIGVSLMIYFGTYNNNYNYQWLIGTIVALIVSTFIFAYIHIDLKYVDALDKTVKKRIKIQNEFLQEIDDYQSRINYLKIKHTMQRTFTLIEESNGNEGEDWNFYVIEEGNEEFLQKLSDTINKYEEETEDDECHLKILERGIPETEVDAIVKRTKSGYMDFQNKIDKVLSPDTILDGSYIEFTECYYKAQLF